MSVLRPDKKQAFLEGPACGRSSYCVVSPTLWSSRNSLCRKKTAEKTEGLTREESKSRDTQSCEQKRDEILQLKVDWRGLYLGFKLRYEHAKSSCATKEDPTNCPMKEGEKSMKPVEGFSLWIQALLCLCLLGTTEGWLWTPGSNGKHSASIFAWTPLTFSARIFLLPRSGNTTQSDLNATFYDRGVSAPWKQNVPTCQIMHYFGVLKIPSFHPFSPHQSLAVDGEG